MNKPNNNRHHSRSSHNRRGSNNSGGNRNNNNRRSNNNILSKNFESRGPEVKIRGTASHIADKYITMARDANVSGDPVKAENLLQHAEHYNRIVMTAQAQKEEAAAARAARNKNNDKPREGHQGRDNRTYKNKPKDRNAARPVQAGDNAEVAGASEKTKPVKAVKRETGPVVSNAAENPPPFLTKPVSEIKEAETKPKAAKAAPKRRAPAKAKKESETSEVANEAKVVEAVSVETEKKPRKVAAKKAPARPRRRKVPAAEKATKDDEPKSDDAVAS